MLPPYLRCDRNCSCGWYYSGSITDCELIGEAYTEFNGDCKPRES